MSEAARVGAKEILVAKQFADELKFGSSYVGGREDASHASSSEHEGRAPQTPDPRSSFSKSASSGAKPAATRPSGSAGTKASGNTPTGALASPMAPASSPEALESAGRTIAVTVPAVAMPAFATQSHAAWHGAVEADLSLLEDLWDDERTPKGVVKASRRRHRRVHGVGAENRAAQLARQARWFTMLTMVEPWIAAAELEQKPKRRR